jgi:hypothetical protein
MAVRIRHATSRRALAPQRLGSVLHSRRWGENMPSIASVRTKNLAATLLIGAVALISPSMALAHSVSGSSGGGHSGGGSSGGASSSSGTHSGGGSHSSGHSTVSSSSHRGAAVSQGRTQTTSSKSKKRWFFFGHGHVMHTGCLSEPASTTLIHDAGCEADKKMP